MLLYHLLVPMEYSIHVFNGAEMLNKCRFLSGDQYKVAPEPDLCKDMELADICFTVICNLIFHRLIGILFIQYMLPTGFAALLSADKKQVEKHLKTLKEWFTVLEKLELLARSDKFTADLLHDLMWPRQLVCGIDCWTRVPNSIIV